MEGKVVKGILAFFQKGQGGRGEPVVLSADWSLAHYWQVAVGILILSSPVYLVWGETQDFLAISIFAGLTLVGWAVSRYSARLGAGLHSVSIFPYWTWYMQFEGGMPWRRETGLAEHVLIHVIPV